MRRVLSSIEQLPEAALPAVQAARAALNARRHTQIVIRRDLNDALGKLGLPYIPSSTFGRWAQRELVRKEPAPRDDLSPAVRAAVDLLVAAIRNETRA